MGTKVHYTNYLPGFYSMRDLNEDANGSWSQYYEDKMLGQNLYNGYQLRPSNRCTVYDKEMLKRTMLEHEAIFRKQVYELHRIYRTQKDMMNELKRGASRHLQPDTSQSNSFSSQIPSEGTNNNRAPVTVTEDNKPILNFRNGSNMQYGPVSIGKRITLKDGDTFDFNQKGIANKTFDLHLPADVYIDCGDQRSEREIVAESSSVTTVPLDRVQCSDAVNNVNIVKRDLVTVEGHGYREDRWKSEIYTRGGCLTDLNEPATEVCFGKASSSISAKFLYPRTPLAENQVPWSPMRSSTKFPGLQSAFLKGRHCDEGTSSNHLRVDDDETSRGRPFFNNEAGQSTGNMTLLSPGSSLEKFFVPFQQKQLNPKPNERETWFKPQHEISRSTPPNPFLDTFQPRSSWTNPTNSCSQTPLEAPSLRYLNGTINENHIHPSDKWRQYGAELRSHVSGGVGPTSYQNGFNHGVNHPPFAFGKPNLVDLEDCGGHKSKEVHLNLNPRNGYQNGFSAPKTNESMGNCENFSGALSWVRGKPTSNAIPLMELDLSQGYPQLRCAGTAMNMRNESNQETEKTSNFFNLHDPPSSSQANETTTRNTASDGQSGKKIFGFSIPEISQQSPTVVTDSNENGKGSGGINLNFDLNCLDLEAECEMFEAPSPLPVPTAAPQIDLAAPIVLEEENPDEVLTKEAATSILLISADNKYIRSSASVSYDTLQWFAEVVSSEPEIVKEISYDRSDSFELMTLELEETKPDEFWCRSLEGEDYDEGRKSSIASLLLAKPRRGQARKRRQKRDFQRDILPGIASLSRHEVTEDIQAFGTLMKAAGHPWPAGGTTRRNIGRRPRRVTLPVEEIQPSPSTPHLAIAQPATAMEVDRRSMIGWGRTTRRCRRQRLPPVTNVAAPLT